MDIIHIDNIYLKNICKEHGLTMFYYSNLNIDFTYQVYTDKNKLINTITKNGKNINC